MQINVLLAEYDKIKDEQLKRISFRDNMIYVNLIVLGSIISYAVYNEARYHALLIIPWSSFILGWMYLVNDEKVSALGRYIRHDLSKTILNEVKFENPDTIFGWEIAHRSDARRTTRKYIQLFVDLLTFVFPGLLVVTAYCLIKAPHSFVICSLIASEVIILLFLGYQIFLYADFKTGK